MTAVDMKHGGGGRDHKCHISSERALPESTRPVHRYHDTDKDRTGINLQIASNGCGKASGFSYGEDRRVPRLLPGRPAKRHWGVRVVNRVGVQLGKNVDSSLNAISSASQSRPCRSLPSNPARHGCSDGNDRPHRHTAGGRVLRRVAQAQSHHQGQTHCAPQGCTLSSFSSFSAYSTPTLLFLAVALVIFSLVTTHLALQVNRILHAFTDHMDVANAPVKYYRMLNRQYSAAKASIYTVLTLVCDALMIYRVFVVHERKWLAIAVPSVLFLTNISLGTWYIWSVSQPAEDSDMPINSFYVVTLTLNLLSTGKEDEYKCDPRDLQSGHLLLLSHCAHYNEIHAFGWAVDSLRPHVPHHRDDLLDCDDSCVEGTPQHLQGWGFVCGYAFQDRRLRPMSPTNYHVRNGGADKSTVAA
ncbi:uncharacterized protein PHACADRAFT_182523 [Phanerochaete carnosa HHB-10118-sp]|uniref:Uncharacterized protein n=1 Tax=Phanerochaete carnosa (strain HHB-10118-sp) TaxID=650164 RepID=K5WGC1_PHACS|nr:uncharacterized protein PHACADRAFT_182523 [Phanerochaete carnosa HHB-10118-sp]EKM58149.1 hypothetical protein PHACADRAFT_182523 [Phanerochaete carnosa HHB-10118-sp]